MKTLLTLLFMTFANASYAFDSCSYSIKDQYGYNYETHTRSSYSTQAACSDAQYACYSALSEGQRNGRYLNAYCEQSFGPTTPNRPPLPPTSNVTCTTDLVDYYNSIVRSFTGYGYTMREACGQSEQFCRYELSRDTNRGQRCLTRGSNGGGGNYPRPPRTVTETCQASRFDPAGYFVESYTQRHTGPANSDVKGEACRKAYNQCTYEIRGRQTCRIEG